MPTPSLQFFVFAVRFIDAVASEPLRTHLRLRATSRHEDNGLPVVFVPPEPARLAA